MIYRQGDILIVGVEAVPAGAQPLDSTRGRLVLAEGEVTGHAHAIVATAEEATLYSVADEIDRWLRVRSHQGVALRHQEHATIRLAPGNYRIVRQREYAPGEIRRVAD